MAYYLACLFLILLFCAGLGANIASELGQRKNPYAILVGCIVLTIAFKYNFGIVFYGLEYEDAYCFSFCSRQFLHGIYTSSFLTDAITIGSLENPIALSTFGGHFITYPVFLSIFTSIFGFSEQVISNINTGLCFFILLVLALFTRNERLWPVAPIAYCCAPIINVFNTCFLSETFSSLISLTFVWSYFRKKYFLCYLAFFLAILCKRENMILAFIPALALLHSICQAVFAGGTKPKFSSILPYAAMLAVYLTLFQNVYEIERVEAIDINNSTFSIHYFTRLFPVFLKSLLSPEYFLIIPVICLLLTLLYIARGKANFQMISLASLFCMYLALYTFHYRGYFFITQNDIPIFCTIRYINNFFYIIPLLFLFFSIYNYKVTKFCIMILLSVSLILTIYLRNYFSEIEYQDRLAEAIQITEYIKQHGKKKNSFLICPNPLIYQNICDSDFNICDITQINDIKQEDDKYDYYLILPDLAYLKERYGIHIDMSHFRPLFALPDGKYLYIYKMEK